MGTTDVNLGSCALQIFIIFVLHCFLVLQTFVGNVHSHIVDAIIQSMVHRFNYAFLMISFACCRSKSYGFLQKQCKIDTLKREIAKWDIIFKLINSYLEICRDDWNINLDFVSFVEFYFDNSKNVEQKCGQDATNHEVIIFLFLFLVGFDATAGVETDLKGFFIFQFNLTILIDFQF